MKTDKHVCRKFEMFPTHHILVHTTVSVLSMSDKHQIQLTVLKSHTYFARRSIHLEVHQHQHSGLFPVQHITYMLYQHLLAQLNSACSAVFTYAVYVTSATYIPGTCAILNKFIK